MNQAAAIPSLLILPCTSAYFFFFSCAAWKLLAFSFFMRSFSA
jgi:hypothetical protein